VSAFTSDERQAEVLSRRGRSPGLRAETALRAVRREVRAPVGPRDVFDTHRQTACEAGRAATGAAVILGHAPGERRVPSRPAGHDIAKGVRVLHESSVDIAHHGGQSPTYPAYLAPPTRRPFMRQCWRRFQQGTVITPREENAERMVQPGFTSGHLNVCDLRVPVSVVARDD
jgi:hypothetical protein